MAELSQLQPQSVFQYFKELCAIPHGSGNTKQISDYCVRFAQEHGLRYRQDEWNNVVLFQEGTAGYEQSAPVMLQGHLDMVCEKTSDSPIDFKTDGLSLVVKDGILSAEGTTLGGDDGIAVAYALAILAADDIPHPPLEVVLTVDEEIGMLGAAALDCSDLRARILLNLDSEEEGHLLVSCAGGVRANCHVPVSRQRAEGTELTITVSGLTGGHSGTEIDKGRANANQLLGRLLNQLNKELPFTLVSAAGGQQDNAIACEATARLLTSEAETERVIRLTQQQCACYQSEYRRSDPRLMLTVQTGAPTGADGMDRRSQANVIAALRGLPGGVQRMSSNMPGLVQTSLNLGILTTSPEEVCMSFAVRSSVESEKEEVVSRMESLMTLVGGHVTRTGAYPAWEYRPISPLRELMAAVFEEQYGYKPVVESLHAGVECGLLSGKLPGLDCVSFGPDMTDIHTTSESMHVESVQRVWNYTLEVLKRLR